MNEPLLHIVKYKWENRHGALLGPEWMIALAGDGDAELRSRASLGKGGGLRSIEVLDRAPIPEDLRQTGRSRSLKSKVVLYDKDHGDLTAEQFVQRMYDKEVE